MCDPVTAMAAVSMVAGVGGSIMQYQGAQQTAAAQSQAALYNAQVARNNQTVAQQNSKIALEQGRVAEDAQRQKTSQMVGGIIAQEAASGVDPNSGSALNVRKSGREVGEEDALTIRSNYDLQARNFMAQASGFGAQAGLLEAQAKWDTTAGNIAGMSSILGGASSVSDKWLKYQQSGVFGGN